MVELWRAYAWSASSSLRTTVPRISRSAPCLFSPHMGCYCMRGAWWRSPLGCSINLSRWCLFFTHLIFQNVIFFYVLSASFRQLSESESDFIAKYVKTYLEFGSGVSLYTGRKEKKNIYIYISTLTFESNNYILSMLLTPTAIFFW